MAANVGWLVDLGGVRLLHAGDAQVGDADLASLPPLAELGIDVALMPAWYVASEAFRPLLPRLEARRILLMHFAERGASDRFYRRQGGWGGMMRRVTESGLPIELLVRRGAVVCLD